MEFLPEAFYFLEAVVKESILGINQYKITVKVYVLNLLSLVSDTSVQYYLNNKITGDTKLTMGTNCWK